MKFDVEDDGAVFCLRAEIGADLETLCNLVGIHAPGLLVAAEQVYCPAEELAFSYADDEGLWRQPAAGGLKVLCALRLRADWLVYKCPRTPAAQLRANAASRIGHGLLDALELVCAHPK